MSACMAEICHTSMLNTYPNIKIVFIFNNTYNIITQYFISRVKLITFLCETKEKNHPSLLPKYNTSNFLI